MPYVTADSEASGFPALYRYEVGNLSTPGALDSWRTIGASSNTFSYQSAATMDSAHGFYIKTASNAAGADFALWNVDAALANGVWATDMAIYLQLADGTPVEVTRDFGIDYDSQTGHLLLWDGKSAGSVWSTQAEFDAAGAIKSVWTATKLSSTTLDQPAGNFVTGVLGKWKYVEALGAFVCARRVQCINVGRSRLDV
ncbi:MAG: hypothetical protein IPO19_00370 [Rhodoferax sp.]|nr:hypothetical protein [Rhodoferax sp.]